MLAGGNPVLLSVWVNVEDMSSGAEDWLFPHGGRRRCVLGAFLAASRRNGSSAAAAVRWIGLAASPARSRRAELSRPRAREHPLRADLPWLPASSGARRQRLRPSVGRQRQLRVQTGPLLRADGETLAFSARGWWRMRRFSPRGERPPKATCDSEAERNGAGGARRTPRRRFL